MSGMWKVLLDPSVNINPVEIPFLNTSTYVAGRFTWNTISVTFRDPIDQCRHNDLWSG